MIISDIQPAAPSGDSIYRVPSSEQYVEKARRGYMRESHIRCWVLGVGELNRKSCGLLQGAGRQAGAARYALHRRPTNLAH